MFIEDTELLDIKIFYKKSGRHYIVYAKDDFEKLEMNEEEKSKYHPLNIQSRPLTWGLYNDLQESAMVPDQLGNRKWNYKVYKENKLRSIILKWDAKNKDANGKMVDVPPTPKNISKMSPEVAEVILSLYDKMTLIDEEEEKKS